MMSSSLTMMLAASYLTIVLPSTGLSIVGERRLRANPEDGRSPRPADQFQAALERVQDVTVKHKAENTTENTTEKTRADKVEVAIYYEALCPYCRNLLKYSVMPLWNDTELRHRIDLRLYPYGNAMALPKASVSDGYKFWHQEFDQEGFEYVFQCQHGREECFGNTVQACVIQTLKSASKYVPFILCMEGSEDGSSLEKTSYECATAQGVDIAPIKECVNGREGNQALLAVAKATDELQPPAGPHQYVPWVTVNGEHSQKAEMDGADPAGRLLAEVCGQIAEPKPALCLKSGSIRHDYFALSAIALVAALVVSLR